MVRNMTRLFLQAPIKDEGCFISTKKAADSEKKSRMSPGFPLSVVSSAASSVWNRFFDERLCGLDGSAPRTEHTSLK